MFEDFKVVLQCSTKRIFADVEEANHNSVERVKYTKTDLIDRTKFEDTERREECE